MVAPKSAPIESKALATGQAVNGPPGRIAPHAVPISNPFNPDSGPINRDTFSCGRRRRADRRQYPWQDAAEQPEIVAQDFPHPTGAIAPIDPRRADRDQHRDGDGRPGNPACGYARDAVRRLWNRRPPAREF
jgi:hypothetical protein